MCDFQTHFLIISVTESFKYVVHGYPESRKGPHRLCVSVSTGFIPASRALNRPVSLGAQHCFGEQLVTEGNSAGELEE